MNTMLFEVDTDNFTLTTMSGEVYHINMFDMATCCCWMPTSPIKIFENDGQLFCTNLSLNSTVRLV